MTTAPVAKWVAPTDRSLLDQIMAPFTTAFEIFVISLCVVLLSRSWRDLLAKAIWDRGHD